jgi:hypothetical protein
LHVCLANQGGSAELAGYCCDFNGEAAKFVVKSRLVPPDGGLERMTLRRIVIAVICRAGNSPSPPINQPLGLTVY